MLNALPTRDVVLLIDRSETLLKYFRDVFDIRFLLIFVSDSHIWLAYPGMGFIRTSNNFPTLWALL